MELPKTPSLRLDDKTALVTGASSGIGLACAVALAEAGADVTAAARSEDKLDTLVEAAQEKGLKMQACALDVSDLDAVSEMLDKSTSFDILVNSAGMARHGPAAETRADDFAPALITHCMAARCPDSCGLTDLSMSISSNVSFRDATSEL